MQLNRQKSESPPPLAKVAAMVAAATWLGNAGLLLSPLWLAAIASTYRLSVFEVGLLACANLLASALGSVLLSVIAARIDRRTVAVAMAIGVIAASSVGLMGSALVLVCGARVGSGLFEGVLTSTMTATCAGQLRPERLFFISQTALCMLGIAGFSMLPPYLMVHGIDVFFLYTGAAAALLLPLMFWTPRHAALPVAPGGSGHALLLDRLRVLAGIGLILFAFQATFTYAPNIGSASGIVSEAVNTAMSMAMLGALAGPLSGVVIGARFGYRLPAASGMLLGAVAAALMVHATEQAWFGIAVSVLFAATIFTTPYLLGALSLMDPSGRSAALSAATINLGAALGPAAAGLLIWRFEVGAVSLLAVIAYALAAILTLPRIGQAVQLRSAAHSRRQSA